MKTSRMGSLYKDRLNEGYNPSKSPRRVHGRARPRNRYMVVDKRQPWTVGKYGLSPAERAENPAEFDLVSTPSPLAQYLNERAEELSQRQGESPGGASRVPSKVLIRLNRALNTVCDPNTVFPHISPDGEGGASASWLAGDYVIEISCSLRLQLEFIRHRGSDGLQFLFDPDSREDREAVRNEIDSMSRFVKERNPNWRGLFSR